MAQTATITVQYANGPKGNAKSGSVKDTNGGYWGIPADKLSFWEGMKGKTVAVQYEEREYNGRTYKNIKGCMGAAQPAANGTSSSNAEDIFVTGVVGRAMGSGQFGLSDIKALTLAAVEAYREWKAPPAPEQPRPVSRPAPRRMEPEYLDGDVGFAP